jgi:lysine 2,3-aminomutase
MSRKKKGTQRIQTRFIDDIFTDAVEMIRPSFKIDYKTYLNELWNANPVIHSLLKESLNLEDSREKLYSYLEKCEREVFKIDNDLHLLEKATVRESVRAFRSIIGPVNEYRTDFSALEYLWKIARDRDNELPQKISVGFIIEFIHLFRGVAGRSNIYFEAKEARKGIPEFLKLQGRQAANARSDILDSIGDSIKRYFKKYSSGLEPDIVRRRNENKNRILKYFKAEEFDWDNYLWHIKHVIRTAGPLNDLIELTPEQREAVEKAVRNNIPFGITPYYLSLMDRELSSPYDHAIRAQVIPPPDFVDTMSEHREERDTIFDFMGEHDTSPVEHVTRRYPGIAILKPYNTCAQICVYCQRNWEIDEVLDPKAMASRQAIDDAVSWFEKHPSIGDILITGGDPCIMKDISLKEILKALARNQNIYRIRIGTRTPVALPQRWTDNLVGLLSEYHLPGKREIAIVTHFEHPYEITPESLKAVQKVKMAGISVYNQEVFTVYNSRRFESAKLRRDLRLIGVDPYYNFNIKGKDETRSYMAPIARINQERKEEARLLPGLDRTDESVFNVPKLGKNHLRSWQDHRLVMILPDGSRVYEFHPWEKNITPVPPFNYIDVPIYDYLEEMAARGEEIRDYRTIWYYY